MSTANLRTFTLTEYQSYDEPGSFLTLIHGKIYNVQTFLLEHPGGDDVIRDLSGQDMTQAFEDIEHSEEAREILDTYLIGVLAQPCQPEKTTVRPPTLMSSPRLYSVGALGLAVTCTILWKMHRAG